MSRSSVVIRLLLLLACWPGTSYGETISLTPKDNWFAILSGEGLSPGDVVELAAGRYQDARRLTLRHRGTAQSPITIRVRPGDQVVFERPNADQNTLNIEGSDHLHLIGIEITGGAAGIRIHREPGRNEDVVGIHIRNCHLHHLGGVAVTCNEPGTTYRQCVFANNHIHHTSGHGEAFYLGGNHATATFHDGLIQRNYIHHLNAPEITQGDGIEIKDGSSGNRVIANVIHDTKFPGITVYGSGGGPVNRIERNLIWNTNDHGIQAAADAVIRDNTIAWTGQAGIYSRNHQNAICGNLKISSNVVFQTRDAAIRINNSNVHDRRLIIQIDNNQLHPFNGQAIRVQHPDQVAIRNNRGQGSVNPEGLDSHWVFTDQIDWSLPEDTPHPAWESLDYRSLRQIVFKPVDR